MGEAEGTIRRRCGGCTPLAHVSGEQLCNLALEQGSRCHVVTLDGYFDWHRVGGHTLGAAAPYPYPWRAISLPVEP